MFNILSIRLLKGSHSDTGATGQGCFMNVIAYLNGEPQITDQSSCVCPVVQPVAIWLNDYLTETEREAMIPYLFRAMGSATQDNTEIMRRIQLVASLANETKNIAAYAAQSAAAAAQSAAAAAAWSAEYAARSAEYAARSVEYAARSAAAAAQGAAYAAYAARSAAHAARSAEYAAHAALSAEYAARSAEYAARSVEYAALSAEYAGIRKGIISSCLKFLDSALPQDEEITSCEIIQRAEKLVELNAI